MHARTAVIAIALAGTSASAQTMNFTLDDRIAVGFGSVEYIGGTFDFGSIQSEPDTPFADWQGFASDGVGEADGFASIDSMLTSTSIIASGQASAGATFDPTSVNYVSALGSSNHGIGFTLDQETTFDLNATLDAAGTAQAWVRLRNGLFGSNFVFESVTTGGQVIVDETITLGSGEYSLQFFANSNITLFSAGSESGQSSYGGSFVVVPAPSVLAASGLAIGLLARRRRPS